MKKLFVLTFLAVVAVAVAGCQSRRAAPVPYGGIGTPSTVSPAPSRGCGPGCGSCGGNTPQVLPGLQVFAPGPDTAPVLGQ